MADNVNAADILTVSICFAPNNKVWLQTLKVSPGTTVLEALQGVGFEQQFPDHDLSKMGVGVFGERCELSHILHNHDRIEVYLPLVFDPMVSRRRRAMHKEKKRKSKPHQWSKKPPQVVAT